MRLTPFQEAHTTKQFDVAARCRTPRPNSTYLCFRVLQLSGLMSSATYTALPTGEYQYPPPRPSNLPPWRAHGSRSAPFLPKTVSTWTFYGAAVFTGVILHFVLAGSYVFETSPDLRHLSPFESAVEATRPRPGAYIPPGSYVRPGLGQLVFQQETRPLEALRAMVLRTKGFYTRDYSVWLGWNNVRSPLCLRYEPRTSWHSSLQYHLSPV